MGKSRVYNTATPPLPLVARARAAAHRGQAHVLCAFVRATAVALCIAAAGAGPGAAQAPAVATPAAPISTIPGDRYPDIWWWPSLGRNNTGLELQTLGSKAVDFLARRELPEMYRMINHELSKTGKSYEKSASFVGLFAGQRHEFAKLFWDYKLPTLRNDPAKIEYRDYPFDQAVPPQDGAQVRFFGFPPPDGIASLHNPQTPEPHEDLFLRIGGIDLFSTYRLTDADQEKFEYCPGVVALSVEAYRKSESRVVESRVYPDGMVLIKPLWRRVLLAYASSRDEQSVICLSGNSSGALRAATPTGLVMLLKNWRLLDGTFLVSSYDGQLFRIDGATGCTRAPGSRLQMIPIEQFRGRIMDPLYAWGQGKAPELWPREATRRIRALFAAQGDRIDEKCRG